MQKVFNINDFTKYLGKWYYALYRPCRMEDENHIIESSKEDAEFYGIYVKARNGLSYHIMDVSDEETANSMVFLINELGELYEDPND